MEALSLFGAGTTQPPKKPRKRNELWDALAEIFGYEPLTQSEIKLWGKLTHSLSLAGASRDSLVFAAKEFHREFASASLTPTALEKHYSRYAGRIRKKVESCSECGLGGGFHIDGCTQSEARVD